MAGGPSTAMVETIFADDDEVDERTSAANGEREGFEIELGCCSLRSVVDKYDIAGDSATWCHLSLGDKLVMPLPLFCVRPRLMSLDIGVVDLCTNSITVVLLVLWSVCHDSGC